MKLVDEYWVLTRDAETGRVTKMTRLPVGAVEFFDPALGIRPMKEPGA